MDNKDKISDTFLALNYLNLSKNYTISVDKPKLNINMVWDVFLNPIKYQIIDETDRKDKKLIKSGIFMLDVKFVDQVYKRNKEYDSSSGNYYCPFF